MKNFLIRLTCSCCSGIHTYSVVEKIVAVRNSELGQRQTKVYHPIIGFFKPSVKNLSNPLTVTVSAICPVTWKVMKVRLNRKDLVDKGLNPERISLASTTSTTSQPGG